MSDISIINATDYMSRDDQASTSNIVGIVLPFVFPQQSRGTSDETADKYLLIEKRKDICRNEPIIRGTRISVALIVELYHLIGWDLQRIRSEYPHLTNEQIFAALDYYDKHTGEIDNILQQEKEEMDEE